jgi:leader peptidase (prepilin peptidase)/N-methyltransferase
VASAVLFPNEPWASAFAAVVRAGAAAALLAVVRRAYHRLRGHEGLGFGDVKLGAAVGAWLPLEQIPLCFLLATAAALIAALFYALRGERIERTMRLPFGAFLCPALWFAFYIDTLLA